MFYKVSKMILLTGASGFLGRHIINSSSYDEAEITTMGRSSTNNIICDLSVDIPLISKNFDYVIHCSGKAHSVPTNLREKEVFFEVNVLGAKNLLKGIARSGFIPKGFVFISTVAVYGQETGKLINEDAALLAKDPYGLSKIEAERLVKDWCDENCVVCTILRLPLLAGVNPPGNLKSMIVGIKKGYYFNIAGGKAKKSMVLAEDVARIIPVVAKIGGVYNLTDGYHPSFFELSKVIATQLGKPIPYSLPLFIASKLAKCGDIIGSKAPINSRKIHKIISDLTFDDSKAREILKWNPKFVVEAFKLI